MARKAKIEKWKREREAWLDPEFESKSLRGRRLRFKVRYRKPLPTLWKTPSAYASIRHLPDMFP